MHLQHTNKRGKFSAHLALTGLCWLYWQKPGSAKFWFLFQWNMPSVEHFIINQK
jgi:hypothetical protein